MEDLEVTLLKKDKVEVVEEIVIPLRPSEVTRTPYNIIKSINKLIRKEYSNKGFYILKKDILIETNKSLKDSDKYDVESTKHYIMKTFTKYGWIVEYNSETDYFFFQELKE